jgi:hypothetical protein
MTGISAQADDRWIARMRRALPPDATLVLRLGQCAPLKATLRCHGHTQPSREALALHAAHVTGVLICGRPARCKRFLKKIGT